MMGKKKTVSLICAALALAVIPLSVNAVSYTTEGKKADQKNEVVDPNKPKPGERTVHTKKEPQKCTNADKLMLRKVTNKSNAMIKQISKTEKEFEEKGVPKDMSDFKKLRKANQEIAEKRNYFRSAEYKDAQEAAKRCNTDLPKYQSYEAFWLPTKFNR